jgi:glycosyltransferase involved in cell wall biosynthesis
MLIAHVIEGLSPNSGGPTHALVGLACAQVRQGGAVRVLVPQAPGPEPATHERLRNAGVDVRAVPSWGSRFASDQPTMRLIDEALHGVDVAHLHGLWADLLYRAARAARHGGIPYVIRPCGMLDRWSMRHRAWKKWAYYAWRLRTMIRHASLLHFTTSMEARESAAWCGTAATRVEPNGVTLEEFTAEEAGRSLRQAWGLDKATPVVLFLGRIHPGKGVEYLVPAMKHVRPPTALVVVGPDSAGHGAKMRRLAQAVGLTDRVVFAGPLSGGDRVIALRDATVFCLPSDHENFGIAAIEAMAAGCPALVSEDVGIADAVRDWAAGEVVSRDPAKLGQAIDRWISDPVLRKRAAHQARTNAFAAFDWDRIARRWLCHYDQMIHNPLAEDFARSPANPS